MFVILQDKILAPKVVLLSFIVTFHALIKLCHGVSQSLIVEGIMLPLSNCSSFQRIFTHAVARRGW